MKLSQITPYLILLTTLIFSACNAVPPTPIETQAPTSETVVEAEASPTTSQEAVAAADTEPNATPTATATTAPTLPPTVSPTLEPTATNTLVPTITPTPEPTPKPEPMITIDETLTLAINVRSGPATTYPIVARLEPGHETLVVGRNTEQSWWQIDLTGVVDQAGTTGWVFGDLTTFAGDPAEVLVAEIAPPPPTATPVVVAETSTEAQTEAVEEAPPNSEEIADQLRCGKDFCVTYQAMVPIWENGGCVGNHSIYVTVLEGPPPGRPMDLVVLGDTFNNLEVSSGSNGPGATEVTLWNNSMILYVKRHQDGTPYTSEESFNFTAADELIPAEVLAANGYCEGRVDVCEHARNNNSVCRGHYSWRVTFHKFD